jgi:hypothetical protein
VDFWVNGGWDQPNCSAEVIPRDLLNISIANIAQGKKVIVKTK